MEKNKGYGKLVEDAMNSLDGLNRVEANPFLYGKVQHRLSSRLGFTDRSFKLQRGWRSGFSRWPGYFALGRGRSGPGHCPCSPPQWRLGHDFQSDIGPGSPIGRGGGLPIRGLGRPKHGDRQYLGQLHFGGNASQRG